jgi:hypothetical protein
MNKDEALKLALEALRLYQRTLAPADTQCRGVAAVAAIEQALAAQPAPVQEPVAWVTGFHAGRCVIKTINPAAILPVGVALYTTPPAPAVPDALTSADIQEHIEYVAGWNDCRAEMLRINNG